MTSLIEFLKSIPDVIWSGLIASALTLGGVLISNRSNTVRLKLQFEHETKDWSAVNQLAGDYAELVLKLMTHLMPVNDARLHIQISDDLYSKEQAEVNRILGEMTKLNESSRPDPPTFGALQHSFGSSRIKQQSTRKSEQGMANFQLPQHCFSEIPANPITRYWLKANTSNDRNPSRLRVNGRFNGNRGPDETAMVADRIALRCTNCCRSRKTNN